MKNISPLKIILLFFLFHSLAIQTINSQGFDGTLGVGLNLGSALYSEEDGKVVGGRYIATIPGVSFSKYLGDKMTISLTLSNSVRDTQNYFSTDLNLSYDIFNPEGKLRPYVLAGFGLVNLLDSGFTFNAGAGGTYWITDVIGLNAQLFYKVSIFSTEFQRSHIFGSAGLIYSIDLGTNKRIWE